MSKRIYWKVITGLNRMSALSGHFSGRQEDIAVCYPIKEWAKPTIPNSYLFVFDTKEDALEYCKSYQIVVPCYVKNPRRLKSTLIVSIISPVTSSCFWESFKEARKLHKPLKKVDFDDLSEQFTGTVFCDEVYCLE